jgi:hypothetical protein
MPITSSLISESNFNDESLSSSSFSSSSFCSNDSDFCWLASSLAFSAELLASLGLTSIFD